MILGLALPLAGRADLSLVLTPGTIGTFPDSILSRQQPWRLEFQMHGWVFPAVESFSTRLFEMSGVGVYGAFLFGGMRFLDNRDGSQCTISLNGRTNVLVRLQRDPSASRLTCEVWNYDGTGYVKSFDTLNQQADIPEPGGRLGSPYTTAQVAWFRMFDTALNDGSVPQATTIGNTLNYTFESNVLDTSGLARNLVLASPVFQPTANQAPAQPPPSQQPKYRSGFFLQ